MSEHTDLSTEELEEQEFENSGQEEQAYKINSWKKAPKLNRFKFSPEIQESHKRSYLESFILSLGLYHYYFHSDPKDDNRLDYINKVIQYEESIIVPFALNWSESLSIYTVWGFILKEISETKSVIDTYKLKVFSLDSLQILDLDPYDYLFLTGAECLDSQ